MQIHVRQENKSDYPTVFDLVEKAFRTEQHSDHTEQLLVEHLRKSAAFIPELSLVATVKDKIVGHLLLTKLKIKKEQQVFDSLALAPVTVLPAYQKKGIGAQLITAAHEKAKSLGHQSIMLIGHKDYYPKFGYQQAHLFGISFPFEAPKENCFAIALKTGALDNISGLIEYPSAFFGEES